MSDATSVVIVGGGINGLCTAYFLLEGGFRGPLTVVERDWSHARSSTARSVAALRHQFHLEVNVRLSLFSSRFYESAERLLGADIGYRPASYLILAGDDGVERLREAYENQRTAGADVELLGAEELKGKFPWLSTNGVAAATYGVSGEGWIDPARVVRALRAELARRGARLVSGRAERFSIEDGSVTSVALSDGTVLDATAYVNAAGPQAGRLMAASGLDLPVESRKRCAFVFDGDATLDGYPCLVDPTVAGRSIFSRPFDGHFLAVTSPDVADDPDTDDLEVDERLFEDVIRPGLARRVDAFRSVRLLRSWAGHYEVNVFDQNALIGKHPSVSNLYLNCGFSGHGVMHAPAAGRGIGELITTGSFRSIDLSPFSPERVELGNRLDDLQPSEHRDVEAGI